MKHKRAMRAPQWAKEKNYLDVKFFTLKDVLKMSHVKAPQYNVRCVLGKRYPSCEKDFDELFKDEKEKLKINY